MVISERENLAGSSDAGKHAASLSVETYRYAVQRAKAMNDSADVGLLPWRACGIFLGFRCGLPVTRATVLHSISAVVLPYLLSCRYCRIPRNSGSVSRSNCRTSGAPGGGGGGGGSGDGGGGRDGGAAEVVWVPVVFVVLGFEAGGGELAVELVGVGLVAFEGVVVFGAVAVAGGAGE